MLKFYPCNVNPHNRKTSDCVVRAIAQASGKDYDEVAKDLFDEWMRTGYEMTSNKTVDAVLAKYGFVQFKKPFKPNGKTYMAREMDELLDPDESCVVRIANHLTCAKGGYLIDLWDCGSKSVYGYYKKGVLKEVIRPFGKPTKARI